ncbi:MAG: hypothetical protein AVO38_02665 [delta proteobacterium ML8_D]|jgi:A/G-specific adenine glycosylase|nr:MAG: hypothetical protein AVO38_02665 [delta proteobacterium ML8_D]
MQKSILTPARIKAFRRTVYDYYEKYGRNLPWRATKDPYKILVSEIMLQQTQVQRVIEKYNAFIKHFPTIRRLSQASLRDVMAQWQGLGYNRRALSLHRLAGSVMDHYQGRIPDDPKQLIVLPGIGRATAHAICTFAFNKPVVFVETNIRTVFIHHFFAHTSKVEDRAIIPFVHDTLDAQNPRQWYSALMDYGADLKKRFPNIGQRSSAYIRQPPFHGSDREIRGMVMRMALQPEGCCEEVLVQTNGISPSRLRVVVERLLEENLVRRKNGSITI